MPENKIKSYYCEKCHRTMQGSSFYTSNNLVKYTNDGKMPMCKKCMTMHVDNWDPNTYLWILQEIDVPYVPDEWNKLMSTYAKPGQKCTGATIIGRYLAKMRLKKWNNYRWKDSQFLQDLSKMQVEQAMRSAGYEEAKISEAMDKITYEIPSEIEQPDFSEDEDDYNPYLATGDEDYFAEQHETPLVPIPPDMILQPSEQQEEEEDDDFDLTDEDRLYLRLKWGKNYKPEEWVRLEQLYNEMMDSYDIQTAGHIDTLKLICKTSLKANQLIDLGD